MKIIAIGRTKILYDSILALKNEGHEIISILTSKASPEYNINEKDFEILAKKINCKFILTENINTPEIKKLLLSLSPDIGVSVNWKTLINSEIIDLFKFGIINIHAGDLPKYQGNAVPNWAILNGEKRIGLTLHLMDEALDSGPILIKEYFDINIKTKIGEIYNFINERSPRLFVKAIKNLENSVTPTPQPTDPALSLRCYPRLPRDHEINWSKSAKEILRLINASSEPFTGAYTFMNSKKLFIWDADIDTPKNDFLSIPGQVILRRKNGEVLVSCGDKNFLVIKKVSFSDGIKIDPTKIIRSIRIRLGMDISSEIESMNKRLDLLESLLKDGK